MKLSNFLAQQAGDTLILQSFSDFIDRKVEKATTLCDMLSQAISDPDSYTPGTLSSFGITYNTGSSVIKLNPSELEAAILNDLDQYEDSITHELINIDELCDQLADSCQLNKVASSAAAVLAQSGSASASEITSQFFAKVQLGIGEFTTTAQSAAYGLLNVLTTTGMSVGDRLKSIMQYIGIGQNLPDTAPDIGVPECDATDITGANVYQAFYAEFPDSLSAIWPWIKETAEKIWKLLQAITETVIGSEAYRTLKKFFMTLTTQADSFALTGGVEDDPSFSDFGPTIRLSGLSYQGTWADHNNETIYGVLQSLLHSFGVDPSIYDTVSALSTSVYHSVMDGYGHYPSGSPMAAISDSYDITPRNFWAIMYSRTLSSNSVLRQVIEVWLRTFGIVNQLAVPFTSIYDAKAYLTVKQCLKDILGCFMDAVHLNDGSGFTTHLNTNSYLRLDLPSSCLYLWLSGDNVFVTRRIIPAVRYKDVSTDRALILQLLADVGLAPQNLPVTEWNRWLGVPLSLKGKNLSNLISLQRSTQDVYLESDVQVHAAIAAADVIDGLYLYFMTHVHSLGLSANDDIDEVSISGNPSSLLHAALNTITPLGSAFSTVDKWTFTGAIEPIAFSDLNNKTLLQLLNGGFVQNYSVSAVGDSFDAIFDYIDDEDIFFPYQHTGKINSGRYHVFRDAELANAFQMVLTVVAVIAATVFAIKMAGKLKRKAMKTQTIADSTAWDKVVKGTFDDAAAKQQYKLTRKAARCQALSKAIFGGLSSAFKAVGSATASIATSAVGAVRQKLAGTKSSAGAPAIDITINDLYRIITGNSFE